MILFGLRSSRSRANAVILLAALDVALVSSSWMQTRAIFRRGTAAWLTMGTQRKKKVMTMICEKGVLNVIVVRSTVFH